MISSADTSYINPDWSPDGERIVFASSRINRRGYQSKSGVERVISRVLAAGANDIWTVRRDGTDLSQLTTHDGEDWLPTWGASGRIYFTSDRDGFTNIWSVMPEFVELDGGSEMDGTAPADGSE